MYLRSKARFLGLTLLFASKFMVVSCTSLSSPTVASTTPPTSTKVPVINLDMDLPEGDAEAGYDIAIAQRCHGCHNPTDPTGGPSLESTENMPVMGERGELRIASADYTGNATTNQEYILESIFHPQIYVVPGEWSKEMSPYNPDFFSEKDLADLIAWLNSLE